MIAPISSLANMEMALYGGFGSNAMAPSYLNGYMGGNGASSYMNPTFQGYANNYGNNSIYNNASFGQNIPAGYSAAASQQAQGSVFQGLSNAETQALMDDYKKSLTPSEGFFACAATNAAFGAVMNPRLIFHPWNTINSWSATNKAFAGVKEAGSALNKLWVNPENSNILREAWLQHNKALARCNKKLGWIRRSYLATGDKALIESIVKKLEGALAKGDMKLITEYTAQLKHAYGANPGALTKGVNWVKNLFGAGGGPTNVTAALADKEGIKSIVTELGKTKGTSYMDMLKRGGGVKGGLFFMGIEFLLSFGKIKTAFEKDSETGWKQLGQTTVKAAGNAAGWALGEAAALWAFTKAGAAIGTAFGPGVGTLIGGAVGLIGGGLGMWLAGKATKALVGQDVADDIEAKKLANSQQGQVQLLQNTMQRMQSGEKVSPQAQQAVQKLMAQYA